MEQALMIFAGKQKSPHCFGKVGLFRIVAARWGDL
jgi:hypothetical protein